MATAGIVWTRTVSVKTGAGTLGGVSQQITSDMEQNLSIDVAASAADQEVLFGWTRSRLQAIAADFKKNDDNSAVSPGNITVKTNSTSSPGDTVVIPYGSAFNWFTGDVMTKPFNSADITKLFISNAAAVVVWFKLSILLTD